MRTHFLPVRMDYIASEPIHVPVFCSAKTAEQRKWEDKYTSVSEEKHYGKITDIDFNSTHMCVTAGTRVTLYSLASLRSLKKTKVFSRFRNVALGAKLRSDSGLVCVGGEENIVRVLDPSSRDVLRSWDLHTDSVHATGFLGLHTVFSCSDDHTVHLWDLTSGESLKSMSGHNDYVRCGIEMNSQVLTGSYDHTVKLWDVRSKTSQCISIKHVGPVQSLLSIPGSSLIVASSGNVVRVWDTLRTDIPLFEFSNHVKQITTMTMDPTNSRLLTGGLDGIVNVHDVIDYSLKASQSGHSSIMSMGMPSTKSTYEPCLALGFLDGTCKILLPPVDIKPTISKEPPTHVSKRWFSRGGDAKPIDTDTLVTSTKKQKLAKHEQCLKQFRHRDALDAALESGRPAIVCSVVEELALRKRLRASLEGRDEFEVKSMVEIARRHLPNPLYSSSLSMFTNLILDVYSESLIENTEVDGWKQLRHTLHNEIATHSQLAAVLGPLEMVLTNSCL